MASLVAQMVKRLPAMLETRVRSLGWEDPLEKEMATHSSTLAWKIPWTEDPGRLWSMVSHGHNKSDTTERFHFPFLYKMPSLWASKKKNLYSGGHMKLIFLRSAKVFLL